MRKLNSEVKTSFISEEGTYLQNRDYFAFVELDDYACYVIADGIDEDRENESAKIVVTSFIKDFTDKPSMMPHIIRKYIKNANRQLIRNSRNERLKASVTVVVSNYSKIRYAMVGNTRFLYFKDGNLRIRSKDESLTEEMAEKGMVALDKVSQHIERNNLTSYLGENVLDKIYVSKKILLKDGDAFALLTKGIWENCDETEIEDALEGANEPTIVTDNVEDIILSKQPERIENYTLAVTFFEKVFVNPNKKRTIKRVIGIVLPILIATITIGTVFAVKINKKKDAMEDMNYYIESGDDYLRDNNATRANEEYAEAKKIAEKYRQKSDLSNIDEKIKFTENILTGDEKLNDSKYEEAQDNYTIALNKCAKYDNACKDYLEQKMAFASNCIRVNDLIELGDAELENGNYAAADADYKEAMNLAIDCKMNDEKEAAKEKAANVAKEVAKLDEAKKQEVANQKKNTEDAYNKGMEYMKTADPLYISGDYVGAKKNYNLAKEQFTIANNPELITEIDAKLKNIEKLIESKKSEADGYVNDARQLVASNNIDGAKAKYRQAQDIYKNLELMDYFNIIEAEINKL